MSKAVFVAACALGLGGCFLGDEDPPSTCERAPVDPGGALTGYVVDRLLFPRATAEVAQFGQDIDSWTGGGDPGIDNQLGAVLVAFASFTGVDLEAEAKMQIDAGELLHLVEVQATSLVDASGARLRIGLGRDLDGEPADNFAGDEPLAFDLARGFGDTTGQIDASRGLDLDFGTARIGIAMPGIPEPFVLPLVETHVIGEIRPDSIQALIAGAVPKEFVDSTLIPVFAEGMANLVDRDCPDGVCVPESPGADLLATFDTDDDGVISVDELREDPLVSGFAMPDVDLSGSCGVVGDALSVGIGFHAVRARIAGG